MRATRIMMTGLAAAALIFAAGCKTTSSTSTTSTTETTPAMASSTTTTDNGNGTTSTTVTTPAPAASATTSTTNSTRSTTLTTSTDNNGTVTQTLPDGTTVTRSQTTTVVLPNGQVQTTPSSSSMASSSTTTDVANLPPGAVVTKTTTTIKTTNTAAPAVVAANQQPPVVYVNNPPPMTSSTTIYQPYTPMRGRRYPGTSFLVFADRASFSNSNSALSGTLSTGNLRSDIDRENGYGLGFNTYLGHSNFSTEFTASYIRPRATLTPANTSFNPITNFRFRMIPVTGTLQLHFNPRSSFDAYIGGGGAWVHFSPYSNFNAGTTGLTNVKFRNEFGPLVNAGLGFGFSPNFGINLDAKYMWVRANATTTFNNVTIGNVGNSEHIGVNPFIISAGLRFGF